VDVTREIEQLEHIGVALGDSASAAGLSTRVPSCPEWTVRDLLAHIGMVHRWATTIVGERRSGPAAESAIPTDDALLSWYRQGHAALVDTLAGAPADVACWSFLPSPSPLEFWCRRQLHETAIHRVDAGLANGERIAYDTDLAADGIDEIITKFLPRPSSNLHLPTERSLLVEATDARRGWRVVIGPGTPTGDEVRADDNAYESDCVVRGDASDLYLLLWNRRDWSGLDVGGDDSVLDAWRTQLRVRWR
jgi:uncharacterized protein (TIGR03083 family)